MGILVMELDLIEEEVFLLILIIRKKNILVLGIGPTQGLEHTITAEEMCSINFTVTNKNFCLSLHYNGAWSK